MRKYLRPIYDKERFFGKVTHLYSKRNLRLLIFLLVQILMDVSLSVCPLQK